MGALTNAFGIPTARTADSAPRSEPSCVEVVEDSVSDFASVDAVGADASGGGAASDPSRGIESGQLPTIGTHHSSRLCGHHTAVVVPGQAWNPGSHEAGGIENQGAIQVQCASGCLRHDLALTVGLEFVADQSNPPLLDRYRGGTAGGKPRTSDRPDAHRQARWPPLASSTSVYGRSVHRPRSARRGARVCSGARCLGGCCAVLSARKW